MSKSILLVTDRNIGIHGGEWQLLRSRAIAMYKTCNIHTYFALVRPKHKAGDVSKVEKNEAYTIQVYPPNGYLDMDKQIGIILNSMKEKFSIVIFSGELILRGVKKALRLYSQVYIDMHSDPIEFIEFQNLPIKNKVFSFLFYIYFKWLLKRSISIADGCLVVSKPMEDIAKKQYLAKETYRIPCSTEYKNFDYWSERLYYRRKWHIPEDAYVISYSGGFSEWQMINETIDFMVSLKEVLGEKLYFLIFTQNTEKAQSLISGFNIDLDKAIIQHLQPSEIPRALCASDVGMLLRKKCKTNYLAFPNKFAEYLVSGNLIITSPGLYDPAKFVRDYKIGLLIDPELPDFTSSNSLKMVKNALFERKLSFESHLARCKEAFKEIDMDKTVLPFCRTILLKEERDRSKILFLSSVDMHIYAFHIPFMKLLQDMGYEVEVCASNVGFKGKIEEEGFKVYDIPFSRNPLSPKNIKAFFMLLNLLKANNYIMIHTHTPVASFLGRIAGRITKVPHIIYTAHGFHFHEYGSKLKNFLYYRLEKFAGRFTDVLITINADDYKIAVEKKLVPNGKVVYIKGVGVDTAKFNPNLFDANFREQYRKSLSLNENDFVIISVGELIKRKNIKDIILATKYAKDKGFPVRLLVVGDGILREELQKYVCENEITKEVSLLGRRSDVKELLAISNILILTSLHEGLPRAVMEAMAMAKPVVAYNIRGTRDLIIDGETGFLVPFKDVNALVQKIQYIYEHPEIAKIIGAKARERIIKEFSLEAILKDMEKLYREILEI